MGLLECASGASVWRGYDYYNEKKVKNLTETASGVFTADVIGTASEPYVVEIDVAHPRKSTCNCPHADGKRIICKHMVALYFDAFPDEADAYIKEVEEYEQEQEELQNELDDKIRKYLNKASKEQLKEALYNLLYECPEWLFDRFVYEYID